MSKEAMKLALEALEKANRRTVVMGSTGSYREGQIHALESVCTDLAPAITAIREALAEESSGTEQPAIPTVITCPFCASEHVPGWLHDYNMDRGAYGEQPAQQEPVALKWQQAPVKTQWGDDMVVASVAIDKDHTVCFYCERGQTTKVEAMFAQRTWVGLTNEQIVKMIPNDPAWDNEVGEDAAVAFARAIEAAHGIKGDA